MLILLYGPISSGKTTFCQQLVAMARARSLPVAGVLTPAIVQDSKKIGIGAVDLCSDETRLLARNDRDLKGRRVGQYSFDDRTLAWMLSLCKDALKKDALVFVDEIGRLELNRGKGLAPLIPLLAQPRRGHTVVIVRDTLLDKLVTYVEPAQPALWVSGR